MSILSNPIVELLITFLASLGQMGGLMMLMENKLSLLKRSLVSFLIVATYLFLWVDRDVYFSRWLPCLITFLLICFFIAYRERNVKEDDEEDQASD